MGLVNWCRDSWTLMMRTKPRYISALGRKRSSVKGPLKLPPRESKGSRRFGVFMCAVTMFCSVSHGVLLVLSEGIDSSELTTYLVSLAIAGVVTITSGLCLAEYIDNQSQGVSSIYSCCYQYSSEVLAFFIGWTWIISQTAVIAAVCKVLAAHVNEWSNDTPRKFLEKMFFDYAKDMPSLAFVVVFILFVLTGFAETTIWYMLSIPIAFVMISSMYIIGCIVSNPERTVISALSLGNIRRIDEVLSTSTLCILFFSGPQSLLRIPVVQARRNTGVVLGPLNVIVFIVASIFVAASTVWDKFATYSSPNEVLSLTANILSTISLFSIGIEAFYPLHYTIEDMSSDGLLFRSLSKKCKPFCFPVSSTAVHVMSFVFIGLMCVFMSLVQVLYLIAIFPLLIGSTVPYLVLNQRYRYNSSWQYEPMFHTSAKSVVTHGRSRKKSKELQYSHTPGYDITEDCELSATCTEEQLTDSSSSDTDIDSVVEQYKEQTRIANISTLDDAATSNQTPEPTSTSSFRAKLCITLLILISLIASLLLNFGSLKDNFYVLIFVLLSILFSTAVQSLLICLPQNKKLDKSKECCAKIPYMPWTPGMAAMLSCSLLVHASIAIWKICLAYFAIGALLYSLYGIHSSTAANSFYNIRKTHIALRPLPSYGNNCVSQIVPSQQKLIKSRKHKKLKTGKL